MTTTMIILSLLSSLMKLKSDINMRRAGTSSHNANARSTATKEEEVVMDTNTAYETVEIRYKTPSARQPVRPGLREEPVYECPAS